MICRCIWLLPSLVLLSLAGCDNGSPKPTLVKGRITLNGGKWPTAGVLYFNPIEGVEGYPRVPGTADFDADGKFVARTTKPGDGLMPGKYNVRVACWKVIPTMDKPAGVSYLPAKYSDPQLSGLEVSVPPDVEVCKLSLNVQLDYR
jgi:hypothetical protein